MPQLDASWASALLDGLAVSQPTIDQEGCYLAFKALEQGGYALQTKAWPGLEVAYHQHGFVARWERALLRPFQGRTDYTLALYRDGKVAGTVSQLLTVKNLLYIVQIGRKSAPNYVLRIRDNNGPDE